MPEHQPSQGARRSRHRDHFHVVRPAHRQTGGQQGCGWGSPRLHLVTGARRHVSHRTSPVRSPAGVTVDIDGQAVTVKGPKGELSPRGRRTDRGRSGARTASRSPARRRAPVALAARPDPHPHQQHGLGVTEGYEKKLEISAPATAWWPGARTSSSRSATATRSPSSPEGITFVVEAQTRFSVQGIDKQLVGEVAANIRKLRKPDPYKTARACATRREDPPQGRKDRKEASVGMIVKRGKAREGGRPWPSPRPPSARTSAAPPSAPSRRDPQRPAHGRPGRGRHRRHDLASASTWRPTCAASPATRPRRPRSGRFDRRRRAKDAGVDAVGIRPRRQQVPRSRRRRRRWRPRGRSRTVSTSNCRDRTSREMRNI